MDSVTDSRTSKKRKPNELKAFKSLLNHVPHALSPCKRTCQIRHGEKISPPVKEVESKNEVCDCHCDDSQEWLGNETCKSLKTNAVTTLPPQSVNAIKKSQSKDLEKQPSKKTKKRKTRKNIKGRNLPPENIPPSKKQKKATSSCKTIKVKTGKSWKMEVDPPPSQHQFEEMEEKRKQNIKKMNAIKQKPLSETEHQRVFLLMEILKKVAEDRKEHPLKEGEVSTVIL